MATQGPIFKMTGALVELAAERKHIAEEIKKLEAEKARIDERFRFIFSAQGAKLGMYKNRIIITMKPWARRTIDADALRRDQPYIAEKYTRTSEGESPHYH